MDEISQEVSQVGELTFEEFLGIIQEEISLEEMEERLGRELTHDEYLKGIEEGKLYSFDVMMRRNLTYEGYVDVLIAADERDKKALEKQKLEPDDSCFMDLRAYRGDDVEDMLAGGADVDDLIRDGILEDGEARPREIVELSQEEIAKKRIWLLGYQKINAMTQIEEDSKVESLMKLFDDEPLVSEEKRNEVKRSWTLDYLTRLREMGVDEIVQGADIESLVRTYEIETRLSPSEQEEVREMWNGLYLEFQQLGLEVFLSRNKNVVFF